MAHVRFTTMAQLPGCTFAKRKVSKFPVIISERLTADLLTLQFFIKQTATCSESSLKTYAQHLCDFVSQIEFDNQGLTSDDEGIRSWELVDDLWLNAYSEELVKRGGNSFNNGRNYAGQVLRTVLSFLHWAQDNGFTSNLIGQGKNFRIQLQPSGRANVLSHPLVERLLKDKPIPKVAPSSNWIDIVKTHPPIKNPSLAVRFERIMDWGTGAGLRAHEICALNIRQMPSRETVESAVLDEKNLQFTLEITKGGQRQALPVSPFLLKLTWDFIDKERVVIVNKLKDKARKKRVSFTDEGAIFLSSTTGQALNPRSLSNQIRKGWLDAVKCGLLTKDEHVWLHGLRHRFITDVLKGFDKKGTKKPERITIYLSRHKSEDTLERYSVGRFFEDGYDKGQTSATEN